MNPVEPATAAGSVVCILNAHAGSDGAGKVRAQLSELFAATGMPVTIVMAESGDALAVAARQAVAQRCRLVVAAGGDGTVSTVASALAATGIVLGVLPLGTLNHFAKDLKIPLALEAAVATLFAGRVTAVDIGEVNGRRFVNNSSIGLYPTVVRRREGLQAQGSRKWTAFVQAAAYAVLRYARLTVTLDVKGGETVREDTPFVFVGNNRYERSGLRVGERSRLDEGRLWIYRAPRATRAGLLRLALRALLGRPADGDLLQIEAAEFRIVTRRKRIPVATDGEVAILATPLHYRILPHALCVMVPAADQPAA
ncbi:MAG: diacylglycerol kinase family protein [Rhizomicrobium sp.]